jgi:hypothetical protein
LTFDRAFVARNPLLVALGRRFVENRWISGRERRSMRLMKLFKLIAMGALCCIFVMRVSLPAIGALLDGALAATASPRSDADPATEFARTTDRVGFPTNYQSTFRLLSIAVGTEEPAVITV